MEYITTQQAGRNWEKPDDSRIKNGSESAESQFSAFENEKLDVFRHIIEQCPYGIQVFSPDGTLLYANEAFFRLFNIEDKTQIIGKINLFSEKSIEMDGMLDYVKNAFSGQIINLPDNQVPLHTIMSQYGGAMLPTSVKFSDILAFPIMKDGKLKYMISIFRQSREYEGRREYVKAKEYIDSHWKHFDLSAAAQASGLSRSRLTTVFKELSSITPSEYCMRVKIDHIKEKLLDQNLSVDEAFAACGVDYSGYYAGIFKRYAGETPLQYRSSHKVL